MAKLDEQISLAEERLRQLKLRQQRSEARQRALESQRARKAETRRRFLVGEVVRERVRDGSLELALLRGWLEQALTRAGDRALFDLPARSPESPAAAGAGATVRPRGCADETQPAPGLEGDDGHGVGEIEAAVRGFHGDEQGIRAADAVQHGAG